MTLWSVKLPPKRQWLSANEQGVTSQQTNLQETGSWEYCTQISAGGTHYFMCNLWCHVERQINGRPCSNNGVMIDHVSSNVPFLMVELRGQFNPQTDCCFSHVSPVFRTNVTCLEPLLALVLFSTSWPITAVHDASLQTPQRVTSFLLT